MKISQAGVDLIRHWEDVKLTSYQDIKDIWTIGVGHTGPDVHPHQTITQSQCDALLVGDLAKVEVALHNFVGVGLTQNEYDALCSLVYNIGVSAFSKSTLLRKLNAGDLEGAAEHFLEWCHAGPAVSSGLLARRRAEAALFRRS